MNLIFFIKINNANKRRAANAFAALDKPRPNRLAMDVWK